MRTLVVAQTEAEDLLAWMSDCVAANLASYRDSLAGTFLYSDHNGCLPHTGSHVGEHLETPHVDEFMGMYNVIVGLSNYAKVVFAEVTGHKARRRSETRWFSTNDVQELSLLPNALNGNLVKWADKLIEQNLCMKTSPKLRDFLHNETKMKLFQLELTVVVHVGKGLKARNTKMEGDTFEFLTSYDTVMHMGESLKKPITPELSAAIDKLAKENAVAGPLFRAAPAASTPSTPAPPPAPAPTPVLPTVLDILKSLTLPVFARP